MLKDRNGGNREEVPLGRIVLSNMYSIEVLIRSYLYRKAQTITE